MSAPQNYNPYAAPQYAPQAPIPEGPSAGLGRMAGGLLVMPNGATLPPVCVKCGARSDLRSRRVRFSFLPIWARILLVVSPLIGIIVMAFATKRSRFDVPLCGPCHAAWGTWTLAAVFGVVGGIVLLIAAVVLMGAGYGAAAVAVGIVGLTGLLAPLLQRARVVIRATKIDEADTWFAGMNGEAMRAACGG